MTFLHASLAILLPALQGFFLVSLLYKSGMRKAVLERICFGFGVGQGMVTLLLFVLGIARIPYSLKTVASIVAFITVFLALAVIRQQTSCKVSTQDVEPSQRPTIQSSSTMKIAETLLAVFLIYKFFTVFQAAWLWPVHGYDSWANWSNAARFFFFEKGLALDRGNEHFFGSGYRPYIGYPLHIYLVQVWFSLCLGASHPAAIKLWAPVYYVCTALILYTGLRREASRTVSLAAVFVLCSSPFFSYHGLVSYADLTLGFYVLAAAVQLRRFQLMQNAAETSAYRHLLLSGLCVGFCIWTKSEGLFFAFSYLFALLLIILGGRLRLKQVSPFVIGVSLIAVPWYAFLALLQIPFSRGEKISLLKLHFEVIPVLLEQMFYSVNFGIIFPFFAGILIFGGRIILRSDLKYLVLVPFCAVFQFLLIYLTTENFEWVTTLTSVNRNLLGIVSLILYLSFLYAVIIFRDRTSRLS